jgi:hypothetical protein
VIWICGGSEYADSFAILTSRISLLVKRMGFNTTFKYLKEVFRLVICYLSGRGEPRAVNANFPFVKRDHNGLPTIIPSRLRAILVRGPLTDKGLIVCILSCLSIFRVFPTIVKVDMATIITPFTGVFKSLPLHILLPAIREILPDLRLNIGPFKLLCIESAGPNGFKSAWSSSLDAIAFMFHPIQFWHYVMYMLKFERGWAFVLWILVI